MGDRLPLQCQREEFEAFAGPHVVYDFCPPYALQNNKFREGSIMAWRVRRVVTGHNEKGRSCFLMDGLAPNIKEMDSMPGVALTDLWETIKLAGQQ